MAEWVVGDASLDIAPDATVDLLHTVLRRATSLGTAEELVPENREGTMDSRPDPMIVQKGLG